MNKFELISTLTEKANLSKSEATKVVETFFNSLSDSLINGERIEIRGFCSFFIKKYKSYVGRNPKTGDKVTVKPKRLPFFKCGKELRDRINA